LVPQKRGDLETDCSCADESNPCKHIAAVYYLLGEEFDRDPFLIFRLRGLEREDLLARLGTSPKPEAQAGVEAEPAAPREPLPLVRRLGKFPFWRGERALVDAVEPTYVQASEKGLKVFLGEHEG